MKKPTIYEALRDKLGREPTLYARSDTLGALDGLILALAKRGGVDL